MYLSGDICCEFHYLREKMCWYMEIFDSVCLQKSMIKLLLHVKSPLCSRWQIGHEGMEHPDGVSGPSAC